MFVFNDFIIIFCIKYFPVSALHHQGSESTADDVCGHAGVQQEEGDGQCPKSEGHLLCVSVTVTVAGKSCFISFYITLCPVSPVVPRDPAGCCRHRHPTDGGDEAGAPIHGELRPVKLSMILVLGLMLVWIYIISDNLLILATVKFTKWKKLLSPSWHVCVLFFLHIWYNITQSIESGNTMAEYVYLRNVHVSKEKDSDNSILITCGVFLFKCSIANLRHLKVSEY